MGDSLGLIGKRLLLLLNDGGSTGGTEMDQASWLRGTVRAVSVIGLASPGVEVSPGEGTTTTAASGLTVFVEFQDCTWRQRSWVRVYGDEVRAVLVESTIVWATHTDPSSGSGATIAWPALAFQPLVDRVGLGSLVPVEFFGNSKALEFLPDGNSLQMFEIEKDIRHSTLKDQPSVQAAISSWHSDCELQEILRKGSYTIQGRRVQVYQPEFNEAWAIGLVSQHDPLSHIMEITMDQGGETQVVDPRVMHVMLLEEYENQGGIPGWSGKESDGGKGERRRRTASEDEEDVTLKRFKSAREGSADGQNGSGSGKDEGMLTRGGDAFGRIEAKEGVGGGGGGDGGGGGLNSISSTSEAPLHQNQDLNDSSSLQDHADIRLPVKENGRAPMVQERTVSSGSLTPAASTSTPTPPPLKPAPSHFSNTFPPLGQMPSLVPGAPAPKSSAPSPVTDRDESYPKTAALVSPGPVTINSPSQTNAPSVALSQPFGQKPSGWTTPALGAAATENSKTPALTPSGFRAPQSKQQPSSVFGELGAQTNGSTQENRPFGFSFAGQQEQKQPDSDPSQNLFFQCMAQTKAPSPSQAQSQSKDTNYFTAISESLNKEPPSLFKPSASSDASKKPVLSSPAQGLFGSTPLKEQPKASEAQPAGNGVVPTKTFGTGTDNMPKHTPAFSGGIGSATPFGTGSLQNIGGLGNPSSSGLASSNSGIRSGNGNNVVGGLGLLTGSKSSDTAHQNLFLQSSGESTNPFLACGGFPHASFSGGTTLQQQPPAVSASTPSSTLTALPPATSGVVAAGEEGKSNLFTMAEPPKGILPSPFGAANSSSASVPANTFTQMPKCTTNAQQVAKPAKEGAEAGSGMLGGSSEGMFGSDKSKTTSSFPPFGAARANDATALPFEQSAQQKFTLEERGQSSKRDSDSSTNSDLSDLSETEEAPGQTPKQGPQGPTDESALLMQKNKSQVAVKGRPRNKPFKVGQSVLKDMTKLRRLKQSGEAFLQDGSCINVAPHLHKCRECRLERYRKSREQESDDDDPNVACRFFHFRRLAFTKKGVLRVEGFLSPQHSDNMAMGLWLPSAAVKEGLDLDTSKYILANVGDQFCQLVMSEKEAMMMVEPHQKVAWKRAVRGVREMCDVCETTLFNIHWVCRKCGFGVCLDCYRMRKNRPPEEDVDSPEDEVFAWLKCAKGQPHEPQNLMPTQIIPGTALYNIGDMVHSARGKWGIKANCPCTNRHTKPLVRPSAPNGLSQTGSTPATGNGTATTPRPEGGESTASTPTPASIKIEPGTEGGGTEGAGDPSSSNSNSTALTTGTKETAPGNPSSALHWLADLATQKAKEETKDSSSLRSMMGRDSRPPFGLDCFNTLSKPSGSNPKLFNSLLLGSSPTQPKAEGSSLRDLLNSGPGKLSQGTGDGGVPFPSVFSTSSTSDKNKGGLPNILDHIIASVVETKKTEGRRVAGGPSEASETPVVPRREGVMGLSVLDPHTSHTWLCDGRLLCLQDPSNGNNWKIFRECWKQGQPVLVSGIHKRLKGGLWRPEAFSEEFGDQDVDLVNCRNCAIISDVKVREFWDGFQVISKRLKGVDGQPMVLKLKDWPPGEDFRDMMPTRFDDLMDNLPLPEYTKRDGRLNLASRLPNFFVRPDLGPKMYNAYGLISSEDRKVGTTNLHLDVSDAVNVMVYVGIPEDEGNHEKEADLAGRKEVMTTIEEGDVDEMTKRRVYEAKEKPGALWHIYAAKDAEKIRELLRKVGEEQGQENPPDHDPIHDQSWYLDQNLRRRLYEEYGVQGWAIVQFLGDAVFIPAGAPHQVHNLYSCIKVAEDFVSPEHVKHCFRLTQEFRHLSTTHTNHEDKLQVKNIIYHAVKDAVGTLKAHEPKLARS
ncbi:lysine-specific demethylase 3B isoform X1 [Alosa sapidissima]|uniref:lysine-specific demethylase 3B isoform X1 n=1 Tax=Alosa sapidissima TaxID=34773 RepID=UPI001C0A5931|nr:lysine-specific demethylase 3B isoform X1 [Alosa sapidissima]